MESVVVLGNYSLVEFLGKQLKVNMFLLCLFHCLN